MAKKATALHLDRLGTFDPEDGTLNVVIDTPKGSRNKFKLDERLAIYKLGGVLPAGAVFPFDFGFVPATRGGDGDPLDVLVLMDEPAFVGCLVPSRLIGVIEAEQTEDGETGRNDRLIAVASGSRTHTDVTSLASLNATLVDEIEHFFVSYNEMKGKVFKPLGRFGPERAEELVREGTRAPKRRGGEKRPPKAGAKAAESSDAKPAGAKAKAKASKKAEAKARKSGAHGAKARAKRRSA